MKPSMVVLILVAVLAFIGTVVWTTVGRAEVQCEVCLEFDGVETCRLGRGTTEADALAAAKQSACGGNTSGMAEAIACQNRQPDRATCPAN